MPAVGCDPASVLVERGCGTVGPAHRRCAGGAGRRRPSGSTFPGHDCSFDPKEVAHRRGRPAFSRFATFRHLPRLRLAGGSWRQFTGARRIRRPRCDLTGIVTPPASPAPRHRRARIGSEPLATPVLVPAAYEEDPRLFNRGKPQSNSGPLGCAVPRLRDRRMDADRLTTGAARAPRERPSDFRSSTVGVPHAVRCSSCSANMIHSAAQLRARLATTGAQWSGRPRHRLSRHLASSVWWCSQRNAFRPASLNLSEGSSLSFASRLCRSVCASILLSGLVAGVRGGWATAGAAAESVLSTCRYFPGTGSSPRSIRWRTSRTVAAESFLSRAI